MKYEPINIQQKLALFDDLWTPKVIAEMKSQGLGHVKICVGGAPVNQMFADEIGADGYAPDAASAVDLFKSLDPKGIKDALLEAEAV